MWVQRYTFFITQVFLFSEISAILTAKLFSLHEN